MQPLNKEYMKGFNDGYKQGKKDSVLKMHHYLVERLNSLKDLGGVGEKTFQKIHRHILDGVRVKGND